MRLHRFFIPQTIGSQTQITVLSAELVNQIRHVFRLKTGDIIKVFDGSGSDYECRISDFQKESLLLDVQGSERSKFMPESEVCLLASIVKKDNFEWIVEKATELGVTRIIPVVSERSEKKSLNEDRIKKIAIEASEQSGRGTIPVIERITSLADAIDNYGSPTSLIFHTEGKLFHRSDLEKTDNISVFIGPEGGWSLDEIDMFHEKKIPMYCLGAQVLRAETAVVAALSLVMLG